LWGCGIKSPTGLNEQMTFLQRYFFLWCFADAFASLSESNKQITYKFL
jgi:hypothetical protein